MAQAKKRAAAPDKPATKETKSPGVKRTTMGALGKTLPIGSLVSGTLVKELTTKPWKTRDERELGREKKQDTTPAQYISLILRRMCPTLGTFKASEHTGDDAREKALLALGRQYSGDVLFAYIRVRIEAIGTHIPLEVKCNSCGQKFKFNGDLESVDVFSVEDPRDLIWSFELEDEAEVRGKPVKSFRMGPTRWSVMDEAMARGARGNMIDEAAVKLAQVRGSIVGINDDDTEVSLAEPELDDLSKRDFERLVAETNDHALGPKLTIDGNCPHCGAEFSQVVSWRHDDFFSTSSLS